ncbi:hypothetical protein, partial [Winogradskyella alexanderae]
TGILRPEFANYQFVNPLATNQFIVDQTINIANVSEGPAIFDPALIEANSNPDLRHYLSLGNDIDPTDYVEFIYNAPITASSNKYVLITERAGNNPVTVQALDNMNNLTGNVINVTNANYINTGVVTDFGQNIEIAVYPLTALVSSGSEISGIRITQIGAGDLSFLRDGGDGKVFILYDPAFLTPPPTFEATTGAACPLNSGTITVDATDNGGGTIEYSLTSLSGLNDRPWQASNVFTGLPVDTYTPVVRYQSNPGCIAVSSNPIVLDNSGFNITGITVTDVTSCNNNGTPSDITDDFFTLDVIVDFVNPPASGTLNITGDVVLTENATNLDSSTSHTFNDVVLPTNGQLLSVFRASFSDAPACIFESIESITAPFECSDDACPDVIPIGNPTSPLTGAEVTFDIDNPGDNTLPATLNSMTVTGQPNPFTGILRPEFANYQFVNPLATNQFIV